MNTKEEQHEEYSDEEIEAELHEGGFPSAPWKQFYSDPSGRISSTSSGGTLTNLILAIGCFIAASFVNWNIQFDDPRDDMIVYFMRGIFPLFGMFCIVRAAFSYSRREKFGTSTFTIRNETGVIGGTLSGVVQTSREVNPTGDYEVTLTCYESYESTNSDGNTRMKERSLWSNTAKIPYKGVSSLAGIPVSIAVPSHMRQSSLYAGSGSISWILKITAPTPGVNFKAIFPVPVFHRKS